MTDDDFPTAPWEPERPDEGGQAHAWGSDGDLVAIVCDNPVYDETAMDRARLIAAAPDLLEAAEKAERALSWVEDDPPTAQDEEKEALQALRDALEKAA